MGEKIIDAKMSEIMEEKFLDYSKAVIMDRALPDVRDGMKPVQLRILWSMYESGYLPDAKYKKCARIVGDVMGKYHPHGDSSIYGALVNLEQDFLRRYPLIDGHGNFGTTDDEPAAMRYTEARLAPTALYLLQGLKKNAVDFVNNYDDSEKEPVCLPAVIPNLLINGTSGIAVGMASDIPPHNLSEVIEAVKAYIANEKITVEELMDYVKGPDFPTGGIISSKGLLDCYKTSKGAIKVRGEVIEEKIKGTKKRVVIKSLPYQVSKANILKKIGRFIEDKNINYVTSVRDESNKNIRIVIDLKKDVDVKEFIFDLYKNTDLEKNYYCNMLALVDKKPVLLSLKDFIKEFVSHRREVFIRITTFEKEKAEKRLHILEGLLTAVQNIDETVNIIKNSKNPKEAKANLMKRFNLTDIQAQAVLDLKLQKITKLEVTDLQKEIKSLQALIKKLADLLKSPKKRDKEIINDLERIKGEIGLDKRLTKITKF